MKATNVTVEENKDAGAVAVPESKPQDVQEACNMDNSENGEAKVVEVPWNRCIFFKNLPLPAKAILQ